jgi:hypothetical protein
MTNRFKAIVVGLALGLITSTAAHAKSELASISITPLWPTNANPGNVVLYQVTVERLGQGLLEVDLSTACLPAGCVASFASNPVRFTGRDPRFIQFIMAIAGNQPTPTDPCAFTVTGKARNETITVTNSFPTLSSIGPAAPMLVSLDLRPGGDVELRGLGATGQSYEIEATADLANPTWASVGSCTADGNGRFTFTHADAQAQAAPMGFYRAVKLAPVNP